ncbi:hypothetical protein PMAYCL1PPCAC_09847, partial [Pristionchus mayeri]
SGCSRRTGWAGGAVVGLSTAAAAATSRSLATSHEDLGDLRCSNGRGGASHHDHLGPRVVGSLSEVIDVLHRSIVEVVDVIEQVGEAAQTTNDNCCSCDRGECGCFHIEMGKK